MTMTCKDYEREKIRRDAAKEFAADIISMTDKFVDLTDIVNYILLVKFGVKVEGNSDD